MAALGSPLSDFRENPGTQSGRAIRAVAIGLAPLLALYAMYTFLRWTVVGRAASIGDQNADRVMRAQSTIGLDRELWIQQHVTGHSFLVWLFNHYYVFGFFPVLVLSAFVAGLRNPGAFNFWRKAFAVSLGLALVGFMLFPLTPPRLLGASHGYVDTLLVYGPQYYGDEAGSSLFNGYGSIPSIVNEQAAMPSMHVGWSAIAALLILAAFPGRRWLAPLLLIHVFMMQLAVIATGNHFVVDGLVGLLVVATAALLVRWATSRDVPGKIGRSLEYRPAGD